jgi:hypothetical protein
MAFVSIRGRCSSLTNRAIALMAIRSAAVTEQITTTAHPGWAPWLRSPCRSRSVSISSRSSSRSSTTPKPPASSSTGVAPAHAVDTRASDRTAVYTGN